MPEKWKIPAPAQSPLRLTPRWLWKAFRSFLAAGESRVRHHPTRRTKRKPTLQTEGGPPFVIIQFVEDGETEIPSPCSKMEGSKFLAHFDIQNFRPRSVHPASYY